MGKHDRGHTANDDRTAGRHSGDRQDATAFLNRPTIDQSLSRHARSGKLLRAGRGIYVAPVKSRFGTHPPLAEQMIEEFGLQLGEAIAPSGATSANALGLTTQIPVRAVYWTSGRGRKLNLGRQSAELKHVPSWQLVFAKEPAGEIVRALAWAGTERVHWSSKISQ